MRFKVSQEERDKVMASLFVEEEYAFHWDVLLLLVVIIHLVIILIMM